MGVFSARLLEEKTQAYWRVSRARSGFESMTTETAINLMNDLLPRCESHPRLQQHAADLMSSIIMGTSIPRRQKV